MGDLWYIKDNSMTYYDVLTPPLCTGDEFDMLLSLGWYPMEQTIFTTSHLFREDGEPPRRVHWLRYPVSSVKEKASHRRILRKNRVFHTELVDPFEHSEELDSLYKEYLDSVDFDGYSTIETATFPKGGTNIYDTKAFLVREEDRTIACGIFHCGNNAAASILHFYNPRYSRFSPGKFLILRTLDYCRRTGMEWYYPGYLIQGDPKMDYKLFLGRDTVQYYHPEPDPLHGTWRPFGRG